MEFEHIFRGTPAEFGVAVKEIDRAFSIGGARYPPEGKGMFAIGAIRPDANPVTAQLYLDDEIEGGSTRRVEIRAYKLPNGDTRLSGHVDAKWPEALSRWENLYSELSRQGWIEGGDIEVDSKTDSDDGIKQPIQESTTSDGYRTENQINLDEACKAWAGRPTIPYQNKREFLDSLEKRTNDFYSMDEFKRALRDAYSRGIIDKGKNGRYKLKNCP